ncbi:hypothetical protein A2U01_0002426 [Trifolium medium]|uniref:Uncharacterized protein n=1 Tax=Trifolium medium TaxID=97028 RepID=A0A392M309_9FABA|nr:hypothetical protein [Trifolium medium]
MSDKLAFLNLEAANAGLQPLVGEDDGDIGLDSDFVVDVEIFEDADDEGVLKKRHDREDGERSPPSKKSKKDVDDSGRTVAESAEIVMASTPSPSHLATVDQTLNFFQGLSSPVSFPPDLRPISLGSPAVVWALETRVEKLEAQNTLLSTQLTAKTNEANESRRSKKRSLGSVKELAERITSFEDDVKNYGAPFDLCKERNESKAAYEKLRKEFGNLLARSAKGIVAGFNQALELVEEKNPGLVLDRSVYKLSNCPASKTPPPAGGGA